MSDRGSYRGNDYILILFRIFTIVLFRLFHLFRLFRLFRLFLHPFHSSNNGRHFYG